MEVIWETLGVFLFATLSNYFNYSAMDCHGPKNKRDSECSKTNDINYRTPQDQSIFSYVEAVDSFHLWQMINTGSNYPIDWTSYSFFTCYHEPIFTFQFYLEPFQANLWLIFLFTAISIALFLNLIIIVKFGRGKFKSFSSLLFVLSTIVDDSCGMPECLKSLDVVRLSLGAWFLASVLFVNAYIGIVISSLTSPFNLQSITSFHNLTTIRHKHQEIIRQFMWQKSIKTSFNSGSDSGSDPYIEDFTIFSSAMEDTDGHCGSAPQGPISESCFQSFWLKLVQFGSSIKQKTDSWDYLNTLPNLNESMLTEMESYSPKFQFINELFFSLVNPMHMKPPPGGEKEILFNKETMIHEMKDLAKYSFLIEKEMINCGRTAFVDFHATVLAEIDYMRKHYPWIKFFLAEEQILQQPRFWHFVQVGSSLNYFKNSRQFITSGILDHTLKYFQTGRFRRRRQFTLSNISSAEKRGNGPRAVSLGDKIQTCFMLYAGFVSASLVVGILEYSYLKINYTTLLLRAKLFVVVSLQFVVRQLHLIYVVPKKSSRKFGSGKSI